MTAGADFLQMIAGCGQLWPDPCFFAVARSASAVFCISRTQQLCQSALAAHFLIVLAATAAGYERGSANQLKAS